MIFNKTKKTLERGAKIAHITSHIVMYSKLYSKVGDCIQSLWLEVYTMGMVFGKKDTNAAIDLYNKRINPEDKLERVINV